MTVLIRWVEKLFAPEVKVSPETLARYSTDDPEEPEHTPWKDIKKGWSAPDVYRRPFCS